MGIIKLMYFFITELARSFLVETKLKKELDTPNIYLKMFKIMLDET